MTTQHSSRHLAATRVRERKHDIVDRWKVRVEEHLEGAKSADTSELVDMIPDMIDRFAFALGSRNPWRHLEEAATWIGREHGKQRAQQTAFTLEEVIVEYRLLHQILLDTLDEGEPLDGEARDLISDGILAAIRFAASEFARMRGLAAETELRAETECREQFASLTHDLRSALAAAKAAADLIDASSAEPAKVKDLATKISAALTRADRMISDLLDARRVSAGEIAR